MRSKEITLSFYTDILGFYKFGGDYEHYLMLKKDEVEIHFFLYSSLKVKENYSQVYFRVENIEEVYKAFLERKVPIHPNAPLEIKPWGMKEFSILDPDLNLLTFGEVLETKS